MLIYDADGNELGDIPVSDAQLQTLQAGGNVVMQYHTPQALRGSFPPASGKFNLHMVGDAIVADNVAAALQCAQQQQALRALSNA